MNTRQYLMMTVAAGVLSTTAAFAQNQPAPASGQQLGKDEVPVTLVGCLQRESDYRREQNRGRSALGTGIGSGDEFILVKATRINSPGTPVPSADCAAAGTGDAYELTGENEDKADLEAFVGQRVEITGYIKKAATEVSTSGEVRPSGGSVMEGGDLKLWEVHIEGFKAPVMAQVREEQREQPIAQAEPAPAPMPESRSVGTAGQQPAPAASEPARELPRTASPLPLAGLATLMLFAGAFGIHALRRSL